MLEETTDDGTQITRIQYTIGDDVIGQTRSSSADGGTTWTAGSTQYLLYDGHGSTRQLLNHSGTVQDTYNYDGYGVMLSDGSGAEAASTAARNDTSLLYCGEQYDANLDQYYLRARWYNPANGLFNRVDPFSGNTQDPQSLHKYLYCHANPINNIDPSGMMTLPDLLVSVAIVAMLTAVMLPAYRGAYRQAKAIASRAGFNNIFTAIFKGAFTLNDWKQVLFGYWRGAGAGAVNILDLLSFRQIDPLHEYRDNLWQSEGLDESWVGSASNTFAWIGTTSLYAAAAVWAWSAVGGGGTMDIAVSKGAAPYFIHVEYGVGGVFEQAVLGTGACGLGGMTIIHAGGQGALLTGIPVLFPSAVLVDSGYAFSCVTAAIHAWARGWGLP